MSPTMSVVGKVRKEGLYLELIELSKLQSNLISLGLWKPGSTIAVACRCAPRECSCSIFPCFSMYGLLPVWSVTLLSSMSGSPRRGDWTLATMKQICIVIAPMIDVTSFHPLIVKPSPQNHL
eukprot:3415157-Amphidinium_carterae.3